MFLGVMRSIARSRILRRISNAGVLSARSTSISSSLSTSPWSRMRSCRRSSTIIFTLLSLCVTSSWQKQLAAARIAVGACAHGTSLQKDPLILTWCETLSNATKVRLRQARSTSQTNVACHALGLHAAGCASARARSRLSLCVYDCERAWEREVRVVAQSYTTAGLVEPMSASTILMYFPLSAGFCRHTCTVTARCDAALASACMRAGHASWACAQQCCAVRRAALSPQQRARRTARAYAARMHSFFTVVVTHTWYREILSQRPPRFCAHLADKLKHGHLQDRAPVDQLVDLARQVRDRAVGVVVREEHEGVALRRDVLL